MKKRYLIFLFAALLLLLCGCESKKEVKTGYQIYYLNADKTKLNPMEYHPKHKDAEEMVKEFLRELSSVPEDYNMDAATEVFCRAAVVRTMTQIPDISCVSFFVGDSPLVDSKNNVVGLMTAESFVENPGEQINAIQTTTLTLYFSNRDGDALVKETQTVHYSSNISIEKLVIEHLLEQPKNAKGKSAIPSGTKLLSVTTVDGVCYVNFDAGFTNQDYEIQEPIVIYSIVNSLSELSTVSKVQISVNGSTKGVYRDSYKLDKIYDRNLDYLEERQKGEKAKSE